MAVLSEEMKRWLGTMVATYKVCTPLLQKFVSQEIVKVHAHYEKTYKLKTFTYSQVNSNYKADPLVKSLKFRNINNNMMLHENVKKDYDYSVNNVIDFVKLFLPDYLAEKMTAFDESFDLSAILRLLGVSNPSPIFTSPDPTNSIQAAADDVREEVRNKFSHFDPMDWTEQFFNDCFTKLEVLIKSLGQSDGGKATLDQLADCKAGASHLCTIDPDLFSLVPTDVQKQLSTLQDSIKIVEEQQSATQGEVACLGKRLSSLEDQEPFKRIRLKIQDERLHHQDGRLDKIEKEAGVLVTQVQGLEKEVIEISRRTSGNSVASFSSFSETSCGSSNTLQLGKNCQDQQEEDDDDVPCESSGLGSEYESSTGCSLANVQKSVPQQCRSPPTTPPHEKDTSMQQFQSLPAYASMHFKEINPKESEMEGGGPFYLVYMGNIPDNFESGWAFIGSKRVKVGKVEDQPNCLLGTIPAGEKPGLVDVTVVSQDYKFSLGETKFLYVDNDEKRKVLQRCIHYKDWRTLLFSELANDSAKGSGSSPPSCGQPSQEKTSQAVDMLHSLVDMAAETDGYEFIQKLFSSSAGKVVFSVYKDRSPEEIARSHGHEKTANLLKEIFERFSKEERGNQEIDWKEVLTVFGVTQEQFGPKDEKVIGFDALSCSRESIVIQWLNSQGGYLKEDEGPSKDGKELDFDALSCSGESTATQSLNSQHGCLKEDEGPSEDGKELDFDALSSSGESTATQSLNSQDGCLKEDEGPSKDGKEMDFDALSCSQESTATHSLNSQDGCLKEDEDDISKRLNEVGAGIKSRREELDSCFRRARKKNKDEEILVRGPLAVHAYKSALKDAKTHIKRVAVMIIGQNGVGKTSLVKSLKGETFSIAERSTEGIEIDPSYFKFSTEIWKPGERGKETDYDSKCLFDHHAAKLMIRESREEKRDSNYSGKTEDAKESPVTTDKRDTSFRLSDEPCTSTKPTEEEAMEKIFISGVTENVATLVEDWLLANDEDEDDDDNEDDDEDDDDNDDDDEDDDDDEHEHEHEHEEIHSVLWDFGGKLVYYNTHPIFLTEKALYLLCYDLSLHPQEKANVPVRQGLYKMNEEISELKTNLDYLDFWMSSVYSLVRPDAPCEGAAVSAITPTRFPPVFLVCTHADQPYRSTTPRQVAHELYGFFREKVYGNHLIKDVFVVDNTKSGGKSECPEVVRLRTEILAVAKELPQMKESVPLKWLRYENELQLLRNYGYKWIPFEKARQVALVKCGINDDEQFRTMLNFLHDQRILINFSETPELEAMVILDPQWLIDVLKKLITFESYEHSEENVEELWVKLEGTGILDERLLYHAWGPLFESQVTCQNLIALMERFSLLCSWPSVDTNKQYLVPSMILSPPAKDVSEVLDSVQIPSLYIRFEAGRVPPGLFTRLVLQVYKWCKEEWKSPLNPKLFHNFALFFILPDRGTSLTLLSHSSSIEVVVHNGSDDVDLTISRDVLGKLRLILECMRMEFDWLKNMRYEMCVCCPVCSQKGSVKCRAHDVRGCECLHLLSKSELQKVQYCTRAAFLSDRRIHTEMFAPWFSFSDAEEDSILVKQEQVTTGRTVDNRNILSFKDGMDETTLALPASVLDSLRCQPCDPKEVVVRLQECLQLNQTTLENPDPETKRWIRCLANAAKSEGRMDVVKYLRTIAPAGTTGPLLPEDLDVGRIPFKKRKELTICFSGGTDWKLLAERLGMSFKEIRFLDKRVTNPCDVILNLMAQHRYFSVGELYDKLVEIDRPLAADLL